MAADYSGTPLWRKLGIKEKATIVIDGEPKGFAKALGPLPDGARNARSAEPCDVIVAFVTSRKALKSAWSKFLPRLVSHGGMWISWPKKSSNLDTDLDFDTVQSSGLAAKLVDNKVCSIDDDWTALRFVVPVAQRAKWLVQR